MTATDTRPPASRTPGPPTALPRARVVPPGRIKIRKVDPADGFIIGGAAVGAFALTWIVYELLAPAGGGLGFWTVWFALFLATAWFLARQQHDAIRARDTVMRVVLWSAGIGLLVPLTLVATYTIARGYHALTTHFFFEDQKYVGPLSPPTEGGASHAIVGTIEQVALAILMSVPLAIGTAVYLNEVKGRLARPTRVIVDAMSAIPSIIAGLFILAAVILALGYHQGGFAAGLALSVLMLPTVTRTAEVVLRLVPGGLREASLALGGSEWKTTRRVVLPTARSGMATAVILGIARIIGETAPLLLVTFGAREMNWNPFEGTQSNLGLFIYKSVTLPQEAMKQRAWTGALVLFVIILVLFVIARILGGRGPGHIGRIRRARLARKGLA